MRDSFRADAVRIEAKLRVTDPEGMFIAYVHTEDEWRQCVVLVGVSEVKYLLWDDTAGAPHGASSAVQLAADAVAQAAADAAAAENAAYLARLAAAPPYVRPASCAREPLGWWATVNVRARAAAAAAAESGGGSSGAAVKKPTTYINKEGARCVPETGDLESSES